MSKGPVRATKPQLPPPPPPDPGWRVEGPRSGGRGNGKSNRTSRMNWMRFLTLVGIVLLINWLVASAFVNGPNDRLRIPYSAFRNEVSAGNVTKVSSRAESIDGDFRNPSLSRMLAPDASSGFIEAVAGTVPISSANDPCPFLKLAIDLIQPPAEPIVAD